MQYYNTRGSSVECKGPEAIGKPCTIEGTIEDLVGFKVEQGTGSFVSLDSAGDLDMSLNYEI